jgi:hypothetical protein
MKGGLRRGTSRAGVPGPEAAPREARHVDFKESLNVQSSGDWCELIKDVVAMANSGGGGLVIGVHDDGKPSGADCTPLLALDSAKVVDKIASYTGEQFADFAIRPGERGGKPVAVIEVQGVFPPMVFVRAGTYDVAMPDGKKKTKTAFNVGTVYFRHGAKSEPANSHDLKTMFERRLTAERKALMSNVRKVVHMPAGGVVTIVPGALVKAGNPKAVPVRLVDDPDAPAVRALDPDRAYPFRQTELLTEINKRLDGKRKVSGFDVQCVRRAHGIDDKPVYSYKPKFGTRQYSKALIEWMLEQHKKDSGFFEKARRAAASPPK